LKGFTTRHRENRVTLASVGLGLLLFAAPEAMAQAQATRVPVGLNGVAPNDHSFTERRSVSADGRIVAFTSVASNLVPDDTNGSRDVFVRDLTAGTTTRVSVASDGSQRTGDHVLLSISANGRFVLFTSDAVDLVAPDPNPCTMNNRHCVDDLYVHDRDTRVTSRVPAHPNRTDFPVGGIEGLISGDGRFVAFLHGVDTAPGGVQSRLVFLHDRQIGTITSISPTFPGRSNVYVRLSMSDDGGTVVFLGTPPPDAEVPPLSECPACAEAIYVYTRETDTFTTNLPSVASVHAEGLGTEQDPLRLTTHRPHDVSADGRYILITETLKSATNPNSTNPFHRALVHDRQTDHTQITPWRTDRTPAGLSGDGRQLAWLQGRQEVAPVELVLEDRVSGLVDSIAGPALIGRGEPEIGLSHDGRVVVVTSESRLAANDTDDFIDVFAFDRDPDRDGLPSGWETTFGLDPNNTPDAADDPDRDGLTSLQEYQRGSHPNNDDENTLHFAEGAVNEFFSTRFALVNPTSRPLTTVLRYLGSSGTNSSSIVTLPARSRSTVDFRFFGPVGETDFSTVIESTGGVLADRTMQWDATGYGAHAETSSGTSSNWFLAEGATHGSFDLFYLLQNPHDTPVDVTINYLRPSPQPPVVKTYTVAPLSRRTIWVDAEGPDLASTDVAASIMSTQPVIVERAMYSTNPGQPFAAGHGGAGVTRPETRWFLAEGATGVFFDLFVLIGNPGEQEAQLTLSYLLPNGQRFSKPYTVAAKSRRTILIDGEDPRLLDTPVSIVVESTNNEPVVVERAMWWPQGNWHEAHLSAGATLTNDRWDFAEGQVGVEAATGNIVETYVLIANPSDRAGTAEITLFVEGSDTPVTRTVALPANSRVNVPISSLFPPDTNARFGGFVQSSGPPIVVERAMYWTVGGVIWGAGTVTLAKPTV